MAFAEFIHRLQGVGKVITRPKIYWMIEAGYLPRPSKDVGGRYIFTKEHVQCVIDYLDNPPAPGRRRQAASK